jgi:uncharacterized DUF497 family protein
VLALSSDTISVATELWLRRQTMDIRFTWSPSKANRNLRVHKISFELAQKVFNDPYLIFIEDCLTGDGELRYQAIGYATRQLLAVVVFVDLSNNDEERIHIISARKAEAFEEVIYAKQFKN